MRIISYYTIDTPYEREAARLRQSIDKLGIEHNIVGVRCGGGRRGVNRRWCRHRLRRCGRF